MTAAKGAQARRVRVRPRAPTSNGIRRAGLGSRSLAALALAAGCTLCRGASAESTRVALIRPTTPAALTREALARIQGELAAEGFEVVTVESPADAGAAAARGSDAGVVATIEFSADPEEQTAELRVVDRLTNKTVIRRIGAQGAAPSRFAEILAVRAVELLRASLLELLVRAGPAPASVAPAGVTKAAAERATTWAAKSLDLRRRSTWGVDAGTALLVGFGGIGPALLGVVRIRGAFAPSLQLRATLAGLGTTPHVDATGRGTASVSQWIALLELVGTPGAERPIHPVLSLGGGPMYVGVDGQASGPYVGLQSSGFALALDAGAGAELRLGQHFDLSAEAHAFITRPYPVVRFLDQDAARVSQPSFLATLTMIGWL